MRCMKAIGLCLAAALLPAGLILPGNAGAANFIVKKQGTGVILGKNVGNQDFKIPGEGEVFCEVVKAKGIAEAMLGKPFEFQLIVTIYEHCSIFGGSVSVTEGMLDFNANGALRIVEREEERQKAAPIQILIPGCKVTIGEAGNTKLGTVEYINKPGGEVEVVMKITGATAVVAGELCPKPGTFKNAEYTGKELVMEEGGEIEVK